MLRASLLTLSLVTLVLAGCTAPVSPAEGDPGNDGPDDTKDDATSDGPGDGTGNGPGDGTSDGTGDGPGDGPGTPQVGVVASTPQLLASRSLTTLRSGGNTTLGIVATDAAQQPTDYEVTTASDCIAVERSSQGLEVQALAERCSATVEVTVPATGLSEEIRVQVVDPLAMDIGDGLLIRYVNTYQPRWNDVGSGAAQEIAFWHPVAPEGYHALGSIIRDTYVDANDGGNLPTIVVRDSLDNGALAAPTGYALIWTDSGSGASRDGSVWRPICPEGYKALGVVTWSNHNRPGPDEVRCVHERYTAPGSVGSWITHDRGSGANRNLGVWNIGPPVALEANDRRIPFTFQAAIACPGYDGRRDCADQMSAVNVLMLPLQVTEATDNSDVEPRLAGYRPLDTSIPRYFSSVRMPFTLIPGARDGDVDFHVKRTPFYEVYRTETYTTLRDGIIDNRQGSQPVSKEFEVTTGLSQTETDKFSQKVGITVTTSGSIGFAGSGGSWSVEVSAEFGWESERSSTYSTQSTSRTGFTIPAHAYAQIVQVHTKFIAVNAFGQAMDAQISGGSSIVKYLEYQPA